MLDRLTEVADQREVLGTGLMQADRVAVQATGFCHHVPDVRIIGTGLEQRFKAFFGFGGTVLLEQHINTHIVERVTGRVQRQHAIDPLLCIRQPVVGDVQVDLRQVVSDVVRRFFQQRL
ncbi:hypothetical protein APX70_06346 [Pseudomonas syringae pv. maculicola]|uniref:Uncharacterized protein n=1 Tax=Pseudomonas syringae pv. maculicola TaxID=59511 RepID=A0A3M3A250_PSEYM|nr:hypothetical protein APX70_06346 [Pseudomonas syringae pv. maculicola]